MKLDEYTLVLGHHNPRPPHIRDYNHFHHNSWPGPFLGCTPHNSQPLFRIGTPTLGCIVISAPADSAWEWFGFIRSRYVGTTLNQLELRLLFIHNCFNFFPDRVQVARVNHSSRQSTTPRSIPRAIFGPPLQSWPLLDCMGLWRVVHQPSNLKVLWWSHWAHRRKRCWDDSPHTHNGGKLWSFF